jgi:16S rRNA G966 N2-methylase RsmD
MDVKHKDVQDFINQHLHCTAAEIMLQASKFPEWDMKVVAQQLVGKQLAKSKLPRWFVNDKILYPIRLSMEQCSSEATAAYKNQILAGGQGIDITGGFGIDTYFLALKAKSVIYCEQNKDLAEIVKHNLDVLGQENHTFFSGDGVKHLDQCEGLDWVFIDPARRIKNQRVFRLQDCEPNVINIQDKLFEKACQILIKTAPLLDIKQTLIDLKYVKEVHVVSVNNECKEVLYLLEKNFVGEVKIHCVNIAKGNQETFCFTGTEEKATQTHHSNPQNYIYEANSSIMKAGAFKSIAARYGLSKLHQNTHLYTSDKWVANFPGRSFKLLDVLSPNRKVLTKLKIQKANLSCRNYLQKVDVLKKKLKLKDGGDNYIFATTLSDGKPKLLWCKKVQAK